METANKKLEQVLKENIALKKTNVELQDRLAKIETTQLDNNVILTGIQEQQWEKFEITKQRVIDIIAESLKLSEGINALSRAQQVDIATCKRVGRYRMNYNQPISITFQRREDKDLLMSNKQNLPAGIHANDEHPIHVKQICNRLRPILRYAKSLPDYKDKSRLDGDKLVINGMRYGIGRYT